MKSSTRDGEGEKRRLRLAFLFFYAPRRSPMSSGPGRAATPCQTCELETTPGPYTSYEVARPVVVARRRSRRQRLRHLSLFRHGPDGRFDRTPHCRLATSHPARHCRDSHAAHPDARQRRRAEHRPADGIGDRPDRSDRGLVLPKTGNRRCRQEKRFPITDTGHTPQLRLRCRSDAVVGVRNDRSGHVRADLRRRQSILAVVVWLACAVLRRRWMGVSHRPHVRFHRCPPGACRTAHDRHGRDGADGLAPTRTRAG